MPRFTEDDLKRNASEDVRELNPDIFKDDAKGGGRKPAPANPLAARFERTWAALDGPPLTPEVKFHPFRKWRLDYVHEPTRIAIELDGGIYSQGRHTRGTGFKRDAEKHREAIVRDYTILRLTTGFTEEEVHGIIRFIHARHEEATGDGGDEALHADAQSSEDQAQ